MRRAAGWEQDFFRVESIRVITDELPSGDVHHRGDGQGAYRWRAGRRRALVHTAEGNGPVNALDAALRAAISVALPRSSTGSTSPTTRCASSTATTAPARSPGC